jgi:hypothetical protein
MPKTGFFESHRRGIRESACFPGLHGKEDIYVAEICSKRVGVYCIVMRVSGATSDAASDGRRHAYDAAVCNVEFTCTMMMEMEMTGH